jgi:BatD DUF11 like domain
VYTLRKAQLYPLQPGPLELEAAEVENNVHFVKEGYLNKRGNPGTDMFGDLLSPSIPPEAMLDEKITLQSKPELINVQALPETNKPLSFSGAVGSFSIESSVEKNNFPTDDAGKLLVTISGQGNLTLVNAPEIVWPQGLEAFEPKAEEALNKLHVPVSGSKTFSFPFSVSQAGTYTLPSIEWSFFDAASGKYKILTTQPLQLTVTKGTGTKLAPFVGTKTGGEYFFDTIFTNRWMIIVPVALLIFIGLFVWLGKETKKDKMAAVSTLEASKTSLAETPEMPLQFPLAGSEEKLLQNDSQGFYQTIDKELKFFLASKLHLSAEEVKNKKNIVAALDKTNLPLTDSLHIQQLMEEIEWQLYAPYTDENKVQEVFEKVNTVVHSFKRADV